MKLKQITGPAPTIGEEELQDAGSVVRGEVAQRLERIWAACSPHLEAIQLEDGTWTKPDPRFLEAGIRVLDRMMRLYRLDSPGVRLPEEVAGTDQVARVESALAELEQRIRG